MIIIEYNGLNYFVIGEPSDFTWSKTSSSPSSAFYTCNVRRPSATLPQIEQLERVDDWLNGIHVSSDTQIAANFNGGNSTYPNHTLYKPTRGYGPDQLGLDPAVGDSILYNFDAPHGDMVMNLQKPVPDSRQTTRPSDASLASKYGQQNSASHIDIYDGSGYAAYNTPIPHSRPAGANADGGTYTCTYHGCTLRFETPSLLQQHKREGHRQSNALGGARPQQKYDNSGQAGPHRCDRINPSTGKPCNTIFSRPYDLTRHEDTIHNTKKQKVHCNLCTEEKTFSRADALTRHYRVCHPDVELPGKHRRRGGA